MLPKKNRLRSGRQNAGVVIKTTEYGTARIAPGKKNISRFSIVVSKKVAKKAVERNRAKRQVATCLQKLMPSFTKNIDVVFYVKKPILTGKTSDICLQITNMLGKTT